MTGSAGEDFLSGTSGPVLGVRATTKALVVDAAIDLLALARAEPLRLRRAARRGPLRRVLVLSVERRGAPNLLAASRRELQSSRHLLTFASIDAAERGRFENLGELLERNPPQLYDWLLLLDDDVALPRGFLDAFIFLIERFDLRIAQPAHRRRSHAAWRVTRRRPGSVVRESAFVESGPVVAFHRETFGALLPFPPLRVGWGLDVHWSALARERQWKLGIVDATPVRHGIRTIAASYDHSDAVAEARRFLSDRPYVRAAEAQRTLVTHRSWS